MIACLKGERGVNLQFARSDSPKAIHSKSFLSTGKLTSLKDLTLDRDRKEEKPQNKESLHVDWEARPPGWPGELALLFNIFSLPSYLTGLEAPLFETCGK